MSRCFRVLNIEDDKHSIDLLKCVLSSKIPGVHLKFAENKKDAEALKDEEWDLVICDGEIPFWNNHFDDVKEWFDAPIVMLSARCHHDLEAFLQKGALKAFQKTPREFSSLIEYVKNCLDQKMTSA